MDVQKPVFVHSVIVSLSYHYHYHQLTQETNETIIITPSFVHQKCCVLVPIIFPEILHCRNRVVGVFHLLLLLICHTEGRNAVHKMQAPDLPEILVLASSYPLLTKSSFLTVCTAQKGGVACRRIAFIFSLGNQCHKCFVYIETQKNL